MKISEKHTLFSLKVGEKGKIKDFDLNLVPLKMLELGCLPGSKVEILQKAPLSDPIYICMNGSYIAIRKEIALLIEVEKII